MDPVQDPGVTAPPAEPAVPAATQEPSAPSAQEPTPNGSEPVTNPGESSEQTVPFSRFQEVNDKAKASEEEVQRLNEENERLQNAGQPSATPKDDDLDPEVEDLIRKGAKKLGLVSKEELDQADARRQVKQDINDLTTNPPVAGIPYDNKAVMDYAKTNNLPVTSKGALVAAYRSANWDKILEAERQRAIDGYKSGDSSGAERPGSTGPTPPAEPEIVGKSTKERTRERIRIARQKLI